MTRHSDPRFGESTYRLTNIDRSEPAKSLFEVPADYTLKSAPPMFGEGGVLALAPAALPALAGASVMPLTALRASTRWSTER